jgi:predicted CopG family antitoxin
MSTIAIDDDAHRRLLHLKEDWGASSLNEVVKRLLDQAQTIPASMFGVDPDLPALDRKARGEMWD